jgi:hypothetical protein
MFKVAASILPIQASAVPCERAFSSSKETDTHKRNRLSPKMMEMLQILKYRYRSQRPRLQDLLFTAGDAIQMLNITEEQLDELIADGRIHELEELQRSAKSYST